MVNLVKDYGDHRHPFRKEKKKKNKEKRVQGAPGPSQTKKCRLIRLMQSTSIVGSRDTRSGTVLCIRHP